MPRYFFDVEDGHRLFDPTGEATHLRRAGGLPVTPWGNS